MDIGIGRIVHYRVSQNDVATIQQQRKLFRALELDPLAGGNDVRSGEVFPAIVVKTFSPEQASLRVMLDGPDDLWTTSKTLGDSEGQWQWPEYSQAGQQKQAAGAR